MDELKQILDRNPFLKKRNTNPSKLHVTFLADISWKRQKGHAEIAKKKTAKIAKTNGMVILKQPLNPLCVKLKPKLEDLFETGADGDEFSVQGREIYLHCPNGYGRIKLTNVFFKKKLDMPATTRNWNTVDALYRIASTPSVPLLPKKTEKGEYKGRRFFYFIQHPSQSDGCGKYLKMHHSRRN